jgi:transcriptional regulator with XRE-family HTH domain
MSPRRVPKKLGDKLRVIRLQLGFTLDEMAEAVGKQEVSRRTRVYEWENGIRQPDLDCLLAYAKVSGLSTDELIDDSVELEPEEIGIEQPDKS